jgi:phage-related minor tail protein
MQAREVATNPGRSTAEVGDEPEEERNAEAEDETSDNRKVKRGVFAAVDDIAGKAAEAQGKFSAEVEKSANEHEEATEEEQGAAEFTQRVHEESLK